MRADIHPPVAPLRGGVDGENRRLEDLLPSQDASRCGGGRGGDRSPIARVGGRRRSGTLSSSSGDPLGLMFVLFLLGEWAMTRKPAVFAAGIIAAGLLFFNFVCVVSLAIFGAPFPPCHSLTTNTFIPTAGQLQPIINVTSCGTLQLSNPEIRLLCSAVRPPPYLDRCYVHSVDVIDKNGTRYFLPIVIDFRSLPRELFGPRCLAECTNRADFREFLEQSRDRASKFVAAGVD